MLERASHNSDTGRTRIIACATVIEEMLPHLPPDVSYQVLDFGLHIRPEALKDALQEAIDAASESAETIILGFGLCSQAVVGLNANGCTLVVPRVDDCIAIFLGSDRAYREQHRAEPGTYYLTKGWIEVSDTLLEEYERTTSHLTVSKYGSVFGRGEHPEAPPELAEGRGRRALAEAPSTGSGCLHSLVYKSVG